MGKATKTREPKQPKPLRGDKRVGVTDQAHNHGTFVSTGMAGIGGMAVKRVPVIDTMRDRGMLSDEHHRRLNHYRSQCDMAERSPIKSALDFSVRGSGGFELSAAVTSAIIAMAQIERDMGSVRDIARSIVVDDVSLSQWCITKHGGRERYDGKGRFVAMVPNCEKRVMGIALLELRMAAARICVDARR